jgi:hypothetical protein
VAVAEQVASATPTGPGCCERRLTGGADPLSPPR